MARPTMSKVLYLQQLGRGTRKLKGKEALYVVDVVDNYSGVHLFSNQPWSIHAILGMENYTPWKNVLDPVAISSVQEIILGGLTEQVRAIEKINVFTFEKLYAGYFSEEQIAREYFVSTGTIKSWIKKNRVLPDVIVPFGLKKLNFFSPDSVERYRVELKIPTHDETTQYNDFMSFIDEGSYTMSYKIIMVLSMLMIVDRSGECSLDQLTEHYSSFYNDRTSKNLAVDKPNCPYSKSGFLDNPNSVKQSILANPFEKFERKRFMYHCKDLNRISFSHNLWVKLTNEGKLKIIKNKLYSDLQNYYLQLGGVPEMWKEVWDIDIEK
jgi:hypothetical protein